LKIKDKKNLKKEKIILLPLCVQLQWLLHIEVLLVLLLPLLALCAVAAAVSRLICYTFCWSAVLSTTVYTFAFAFVAAIGIVSLRFPAIILIYLMPRTLL
jgi:hypothetical protein